MAGVVTQIVIGSPPYAVSPVVVVKADKEIRLFNEGSYTLKGKKALVNDGRFWLVFTDDIAVREGLEISIGEENGKKSLIKIIGVTEGISRFFIEDFFSKEMPLPRNIFLDVISEAPASAIASEPAAESVRVPGVARLPPVKGAPPPPAMGVRRELVCPVRLDPNFQTVFPRVAWSSSLTIKGSIYESSAMYVAERDWLAVEERFRTAFCVARTQETKILAAPVQKAQARDRLLSEKQKFLLSVIFAAFDKKKVSLLKISSEISGWLRADLQVFLVEELVSLSSVFPSDPDCASLVSSQDAALCSTEMRVKEFLGGCSREMLFLARCYFSSLPSLLGALSDLETLSRDLESALSDEDLPKVLVLSLKLGNAVNCKYAAHTPSCSEAKSLPLPAFSSFARCAIPPAIFESIDFKAAFPDTPPIKPDAPSAPTPFSNTLLGFVVVSLRDKIDFAQTVKKFAFFRSFQLRTLKDLVNYISGEVNQLGPACSSPGGAGKIEHLRTLLARAQGLVSSSEELLSSLSRRFADSPDTLPHNISAAVGALDALSHLFL